NIWFDGPDASCAEETVRFNLNGRAPGMFLQTAFSKDKEKSFIRTGRYQPRWSYAIKDEGLSPNAFSFYENIYYLKQYQPKRLPVETNKVYLDINEAWTKAEFDRIWEASNGKTVWVYNYELIQLNKENKDEQFNELIKQRFSLFPLFEIKDPIHSLLISKTNNATPNFSDLENSSFLKSLKNFGAKKQKVRLFHIGHQSSAYLSTLKDYRFFQYESGGIVLLEQLLKTGQFVTDEETNTEMVIHNAQVSIVKEEGLGGGTAPDHLMRLFAYNNILKQYGEQGFGVVKELEPLIEEAKEAYVVSPVSSLIVLETQKDYDRYGIEDSKHSLKNASMKSKGAVPEPHEWVLIILVGIIGIYLFMKTRI
ncbi:MAG: XrtN system VIT domain-containing protein, partial [Bacteroidota bacterium]|nr:XrtN system VIT domain-containing protein [Bacteroidota bacterium]